MDVNFATIGLETSVASVAPTLPVMVVPDKLVASSSSASPIVSLVLVLVLGAREPLLLLLAVVATIDVVAAAATLVALVVVIASAVPVAVAADVVFVVSLVSTSASPLSAGSDSALPRYLPRLPGFPTLCHPSSKMRNLAGTPPLARPCRPARTPSGRTEE